MRSKIEWVDWMIGVVLLIVILIAIVSSKTQAADSLTTPCVSIIASHPAPYPDKPAPIFRPRRGWSPQVPKGCTWAR